MPEPVPIRPRPAPVPDLDALTAITDAVEAGLGLPEVVRAAARALDVSLVLIDRSSAVLAVAARSTADERALMADASGVITHELRVGDTVVGRLRARGRSGPPPLALLRVVTTLIASEVERVRAPERASEAAQAAFLTAVLRREVTDRGEIVARAADLGVDVAAGAALVVVRAHHYAPADEDWRGRVLAAAERAARASAPGSLASVVDTLTEGTRPRRRAPAGDRRTTRSGASPRRSRASCGRACTASPSRSATRASRPTRRTCTARATRRCSPRTSPRPARTTACSHSRTPAPTGCSCRP